MRKREGNGVMIHELKSDPESFIGIYNGNKQVEIRNNDREYETYDYILLRQTQFSAEAVRMGRVLGYTGRTVLLKIIHVQHGYGLRDGYVALSIRKLD
jgi:hypothetical protein